MTAWLWVVIYLGIGITVVTAVYFLCNARLLNPELNPLDMSFYWEPDFWIMGLIASLFWPLIALMVVIDTPKYHKERRYWQSPEGQARRLKEETEEAKRSITSGWVQVDWEVDWNQEEIDKHFFADYAEAKVFREMVQPGDEVKWFMSPPPSWSKLAGRGGLMLVRDGKVIAQRILMMN